MVLFLYSVALIIFIWIIHRWNSRAFVRLASQVPSNRWHTFFGCGKIINRKDGIPYMHEFGNRYGSNCLIWMGPYALFLSTDPQTIKDILTSKNCVNKPSLFYNGISSIFGEGLLSENEPNWSRHRKILNKAFSHKMLKSFFPIFHKEIDNVIEQIRRSLEKGDEVDMLQTFRELTMRNASKTTLNRNLEQTEYKSVIMSKQAHAILEFVADTCINPIMSIKWISKLTENCIYKSASQGLKMFRNVIDESVDILKKHDLTDSSYLPEINSALDHTLIGVQQNILEANEIESQMVHLFIGAFETSSTTLYLVILMLAMHPQYQEYVYEEILSQLPSDDNEITLEMMDQLIYLEMVINETMRILPVVPMIFRKVSNENLTLSNGVTLSVGQTICIDIFRLHRSKELYGPQANNFNPDNFLPLNVAARHPFSFIPFTKGQRFCIGWRYAAVLLKISLAKLIKTYKFSTDFKYENLMPENHFPLKLVDEPRLKLEQREA